MAYVGAYCFLEAMSCLYASHNIRGFALHPLAQPFLPPSAGPEDTPPVLGTMGVDYISVQSFGSVCKQRLSQGRRCFRRAGSEDTSAFHLGGGTMRIRSMCSELTGLATSEQRVAGFLKIWLYQATPWILGGFSMLRGMMAYERRHLRLDDCRECGMFEEVAKINLTRRLGFS